MNLKREVYDPQIYRGVGPEDEKAIKREMEQDNRLKICWYGHVYDRNGRWIADAMRKD